MTLPADPATSDAAKTRPTPAVFFGHGSPMNALEQNRYSKAWATFGRTIPKPRAILVVSAHGYGNVTAVTAMARPRTIHDFYGFPQEGPALAKNPCAAGTERSESSSNTSE